MKGGEQEDFQRFCRLVDGHLSEEELARLEKRLLEERDFRLRYIEFLEMDFELGDRLARDEVPASIQSGPRRAVPSRTTVAAAVPWRGDFGALLMKIAALLILSLGGWWIAKTYLGKPGNSVPGQTRDIAAVEPPAPGTSALDGSAETNPSPGEPVQTESGDEVKVVAAPSEAPRPEAAPAVRPSSDSLAALPPELEVPVPKPVAVPAILLGQVEAVSGRDGRWEVGREFRSGNHEIEGGRVEIRLQNGVRVAVEGPGRFSIESVDGLRLWSGRLAAEVVPEAAGFRVESNGVEVIDLGTRFAVTANQKGDAAVHVYDGVVIAETGQEESSEPFILGSGETMRLNVKTGELEETLFNQNLFAAKPSWTGSIVWHSEGVVTLSEPPRRATPGELPEGQAVLFRERSGIVIRRKIEVNLLREDGLTGSAGGERRELPRGAKVSSYLLHSRGTEESARNSGEIRFDSPVLGVILESALLNETDRLIGARRTDYPTEFVQRGGDQGEIENAVTLGENGRTVLFSFHSPILDQIRILVAED